MAFSADHFADQVFAKNFGSPQLSIFCNTIEGNADNPLTIGVHQQMAQRGRGPG
jgi:hypothetical protein